MIIIVEGIDRVGKTTLCNKLKNEFGIEIFKNEKFFNEYLGMQNEVELINQLTNFLKCSKCDIILDRFHLSEYVYGFMERNYVNEYFSKLDKNISKLDDCFLIYMLPTDINESSKQHGKDLTKHNELFFDMYKVSKIKNKWQCTYNTMDEVISFIKSKRNQNDKCL